MRDSIRLLSRAPLFSPSIFNDIVNISGSLVPVTFADDTNVFMKGKLIHETAAKMNSELDKIELWLNSSQLSLNISKSYNN